MGQFWSGTAAVVALRRRILDVLGAEPQWLTGKMFGRQALLARRIVLPSDALGWEDKNALVGLAAPQVLHGLAWGEIEVA
jgi:hypothetical protein